MRFFRFHLTCLLLLGWLVPGLAQRPNIGIGQFRLHLPYHQGIAVEEAGDQVYCATADGFFSYDKEYSSLKTLSRLDGFSDTRVQTLRYDSLTSTLLIAYQNTNLDLVRGGKIININDIFRKPMTGAKTIYHIGFRDRLAYLSASFGLVVLDLVKLEIKETYSNLGPEGQSLPVFASTTLNDSLYIATSNGVMAARLSHPNLLDFRNWRTFSSSQGLPAPAPGQEIRTLARFQNHVYAGVDRVGIYRLSGGSWALTGLQGPGQETYQIRTSRNHLLVVGSNSGLRLVLPGAAVQPLSHPLLRQPRDGFRSKDGSVWVADFTNGLVQVKAGEARSLHPNGPIHRNTFRLYADGHSVLALGGGYDDSYEQRNSSVGFYEFKNGEWKSYNSGLFPNPAQFPPIQDVVGAVRNPLDEKLYLASYGYGLIQWNGPGSYSVYNESNSPLISSLPTQPQYVRLPGIAADREGNIWVTNRNQQVNRPGLHVLRANGTWQSFTFPEFREGSNLERMLIDDNGYKWMIVSRSSSSPGILVFDDKSGQHRHLNQASGDLPTSFVYSLAKDFNGEIWVGTGDGVAVFPTPSTLFTNDFRPAFKPLIEGRPLLTGQTVRAIAVDGGNRKWIGTESGVWLVNPYGDELIQHFTTKNSPLPSDQITDIAIEQQSGEVFIGTDAGLVSYRSGASVTQGTPDCATVFPNPVRPGFSGLVGISGLPNNASVKITDVTGLLVYETKAEGGTASWNVSDYRGRRVKPGVYLVFSTLPDGSQSCMSKVAVIK
ncbi:two-component regulator propeller domain-containing protein [soil metagenome]